jgi:methionyl aminopeptidase
MIYLKTAQELDTIRESCRIVAEVLAIVGSNVQPGISTMELDRMAEEYIRSRGAKPAFKGYGHSDDNRFPATLCTSIDAVVVHGIPSERALQEGEIVGIDVGVNYKGFFGDAARSFRIGRVSGDKDRLLKVTEESLYKGIEQAVVGNTVHDISSAIQNHVEAHGFSVVRDLTGHGVGKELHEEPAVPNFGKAGTGDRLEVGMTLAIEPMVNAGTYKVRIASDGWTVLTEDGRPSAHYEHTVAVRNGTPEILTQ